MFRAVSPWNFDYRRVVLDEVALEGLDGIGIRSLWIRLKHRMSMELTEKLKALVWETLVKCDSVTLYELPESVPEIKIFDRFTHVDDKGVLMEPTEHIDGPYTYCPVPNEFGSCQFYAERKEILSTDVSSLTYEEAVERWGDRLVAVASKVERWRAIAPNMPLCTCEGLKTTQQCMLELIGKARSNGIMTTGLTNLSKIVKDPKILHYLKKELQDLRLITAKIFVQKVASKKSTSVILLRLARFTVPRIMTLPKNGTLYALITHLRSMPDQTDNIMSARKFLNVEHKIMTKMLRRSDAMHFLKLKDTTPPGTSKKGKSAYQLVQLDYRSEESASESEEREPAADEYRVGVGLMRQAYQRISEAGTAGVTLVELAKKLNIDFYVSRHILKTLSLSNVVRHVFEDKGRQRIKRYIAVASLVGSDTKLTREKEKLLLRLKNASETNATAASTSADARSDDSGWNVLHAITEVRSFSDIKPQVPYSQIFNSNVKQPSLRQLEATNAIIDVINEKLVVHGTQELNNLVHKRTGAEMMDGKTLKRILQKLIDDNLLRYYRVQWPGGSSQHTLLLCAPQVSSRDPIISTIYRDICLRTYRSTYLPKREKITQESNETMERDYYYPKYMRARKLHEYLFELVYGENAMPNDGPVGCFNLVNVIPEMTVELALGHIHARGAGLFRIAADPKVMLVKIKNVGADICRTLLGTQALILTLKKNLWTLGAFGLVQFCDETCQQVDGAVHTNKCIYYLNRNAKVVDTTGTWPEPGRERVEKRYRFDHQADVAEFWSALYTTSTNTTVMVIKSEERPVQPPVPVCKPEEAAALDDGDRAIGDGCGAGGFHSTYHPEYPRLWSSQYSTTAGIKRKHLDLKKFPPRSRVPIKRLKLTKTDVPRPTVKKKAPKPPKVVAVKPLPNRPGKDNRSAKRKRFMTLMKWSTLQDKIVIWSRVAKALMSPTSVPGALQAANFVARDIISRLTDARNGRLCHQRAMALHRDSAVLKAEMKLLSELRRRPAIADKFGGLCKKLRVQHLGQFTKYLQETQFRMAELVWIISNLSNSSGYDRSVPCIATDWQNLHDRFTFKFTNRSSQIQPYETIDDILLGTLKEGVIQTMNSLIKGNPTMEQSMQIYNVFKNFPENTLRSVIVGLRKEGLISQQDKSMASNFKKLNSMEAVSYSSTFKLSATYVRRWQNLVSTSLTDRIVHALQVMAPSDDVESSSHLTCIMLESSVVGNIELYLSKKPTVKALGGLSEPDMALVEVDEKVSVKMQRGKVGWRLKNKSTDRIRDLYDDIALTNEISCLCSKSFVKAPAPHDRTDEGDAIVRYLNEKLEVGATFQELHAVCGMTAEVLQDNLRKLESKRLIRKLGFDDNRIVLWNQIRPWVLNVQDENMVPTPWVSTERTLNCRSFVGWCSVIVQKAVEHPGCSVAKISELCDFYLSPRNVEDVCKFLASLDCILMKRIVCEPSGLFADDEAPIYLDDSYEYVDPRHILVFPVCDCFIRFSLIKKKLSEYRE